jgi:hypothetical protein
VHVVIAREQRIAQMRSDETGPSGDKKPHLISFDHAWVVDRLRLRTIPPRPPIARIATPPARRASIEPSPPVGPACELASCRRLAERAGCAAAGRAPLDPEAAAGPLALALPAPVPRREEPPAPGGLMPAPNRAPDALLLVEDPPPICLAWFSGNTYSLAAGEPGSM